MQRPEGGSYGKTSWRANGMPDAFRRMLPWYPSRMVGEKSVDETDLINEK